MVAAGREHHIAPADLEADTGRVDIGLVAVDEEGTQAAQSQVEADNGRTAAVAAEEAGQGEGLDNIHSLAAALVPEEEVVLDRNLVDGDSSFF
jgi:hypothetical protein